MRSPRHIYKHCLAGADSVLATCNFIIKWVINVLILRKKSKIIERASSGVGDIICLMGPVFTLHRRQSGYFVIVITQGALLELINATGAADIALPLNSFASRLAALCTNRNNFHKAILPDELIPPQERAKIHLSNEFAKCLNVESSLMSVYITAPSRIKEKINTALRRINPECLPIIVIHTGPTWLVKEWPDSHWEGLVRKINDTLKVVIIQIGRDVDSWSGKISHTVRVPNCIDWVGKFTLLETAALLEQSSLFIGCDSGPLHIATTVGTRTIGLFGPTDGKCFTHPRAKTTILTSNVACLGCHHSKNSPVHWRTGCPYEIKCMKELSVENVFLEAKAAVSRTIT
jgi:hypothetical protein